MAATSTARRTKNTKGKKKKIETIELSDDDEDEINTQSSISASATKEQENDNAASSTGAARTSADTVKSSDTKTVKAVTSSEEGKPISEFDLVIPPALAAGTDPSCTVLVQIEPDHGSVLDFEGSSGAIGRVECDEEFVTLDFKGFQYSGIIQPGPTAMIVALSKGGTIAKVDAITDEFVTLGKTQDIMAKLDAVVEGEMDEGYNVFDVDVNAKEKDTTTQGKGDQGVDDSATTADNGKSNKRAKNNAGGTKKTPTKKRKVSKKK